MYICLNDYILGDTGTKKMNDFFLKSFSSSKYLPCSSIVYSTIKLIQTFEEVDFLISSGLSEKFIQALFLIDPQSHYGDSSLT